MISFVLERMVQKKPSLPLDLSFLPEKLKVYDKLYRRIKICGEAIIRQSFRYPVTEEDLNFYKEFFDIPATLNDMIEFRDLLMRVSTKSEFHRVCMWFREKLNI